MRLQAHGWDAFVYVAHLLGEADVVGTPLGANVFEVPDDAVFDPEVQTELARWTTGGTFADVPPVEGESGSGLRPPVAGNQPLAPQSQSPLPMPPKTGPGSGRTEWRRYALSLRPPVTVLDTMGRDDIIRAVEAHPDDR